MPIVSQAMPMESESSLSDQSLELRNCDGKADLHRSLAAEAQVASHIIISDEATAPSTGDTTVLSADRKVSLAEQVERAYQQVYEEAKTSVEQKDIVVPVGKIRTYTIYWKQQVFSSTISFTMDTETYAATYTYTLDIPHITISSEIGCTA